MARACGKLARGPHPSGQVLAALARALMLTADEREYLFRVAGGSPPPAAGPSREISPGIRNLIDSRERMTSSPGAPSSSASTTP